ncbi:MAG: NepR family anti-sigma factor [Henriciella sp.]
MIDRKKVAKPASDEAEETLAAALRRKYQAVQDEKIPDRLQRLIDALKEAERSTKKS